MKKIFIAFLLYTSFNNSLHASMCSLPTTQTLFGVGLATLATGLALSARFCCKGDEQLQLLPSVNAQDPAQKNYHVDVSKKFDNKIGYTLFISAVTTGILWFSSMICYYGKNP